MKTLNECTVNKITDQSFIITAIPETDFFIDTSSNYFACNAPFYFDPIDYDFMIRVKIEPEFKSTYDAGAILIFDDEKNWIKAAFELTDLEYTSVVTVVTKESSDDCNGEQINEKAVWLRILRKNKYWSIHYSIDGETWKMVRYFELNLNKEIRVGVVSQSPMGSGCTTEFTNFQITKNNCTDMRTGE
ncbi:MAG: DUF1349 domain-containing protein [bacterium]|nr:DUF1349 domain-containing protein [bacterium]